MDRVEDNVRQGTTWWAQEKVRNRRVELLRPYNLRFHLDDEGHVQLIFFNGRYAPYHAAFVRSIAETDTDCGEEWDRGYHCSRRKPQPEKAAAPDRLTRATPTER